MRANAMIIGVVVLSLAGVAEAGTPEDGASGGPPPATSEPRDEEDADAEHDPRRIRCFVEGVYLPYVGLGSNTRGRDNIVFRNLELKSDPAVGHGLGGRLAVGNEFLSLGVFYLYSHHDDRDNPTTLDIHQAYVDVLFGLSGGNRWIRASLQLGAGFGGVGYHYERLFRDAGGGAVEGRVRGAVTIADHLELAATAGLFLWGYPGRTIGTGGFAGFEVGLVF